MKTLYLLAAILLFALVAPASGQKSSKEEKNSQTEKAFQMTRKLIESKKFKIEINRVFPTNGQDVSRFSPRGEIIVKDTIAQGRLPFFGRAYSLPYGEDGGIEFDNRIKDEKIKFVEKKKKKSIIYTFTVASRNDQYQFTIEAAGSDACTVSMNSNNRTHISYSGTISPIEKEQKEQEK